MGGGGIWARVCVFITAGPSTKMFTWGGGVVKSHSRELFFLFLTAEANSVSCKHTESDNQRVIEACPERTSAWDGACQDLSLERLVL
jgi:hypothetical protein